MVLTLGGRKFDCSTRTFLLGVLNVTPDSFSDGGKFFSTSEAVEHAHAMAAEGADIIDIGGESTRPRSASDAPSSPAASGVERSRGVAEPRIGASTWQIEPEEELRRILPVIEQLHRSDATLVISVDTTKAAVAEEALRAGASIVNDISGFRFDPAMAGVAAQHHAAAILMHMQGTPATMQADPRYDDVVADIKRSLAESVGIARKAGVGQIIIDPGIGFGKTVDHNLEILRRLGEFGDLGCPILVGPSRKSFLGTLTGVPVDRRLAGTAAAAAIAIMNGANFLRVHDVGFIKQVCLVTDALIHTRSNTWNSSGSAS